MSKGKAVDVESIGLRDYFAGQALAGLLAQGVRTKEAVAFSYTIADEMLKERTER